MVYTLNVNVCPITFYFPAMVEWKQLLWTGCILRKRAWNAERIIVHSCLQPGDWVPDPEHGRRVPNPEHGRRVPDPEHGRWVPKPKHGRRAGTRTRTWGALEKWVLNPEHDTCIYYSVQNCQSMWPCVHDKWFVRSVGLHHPRQTWQIGSQCNLDDDRSTILLFWQEICPTLSSKSRRCIRHWLK